MSSNTLASTLDKKELRNFGFVFAAGLILFFGLLIPWIAASVFAIFAIVFPIVLSPLNWLWLKIRNRPGLDKHPHYSWASFFCYIFSHKSSHENIT